jgi:hypothetical protein
MTPITRTRLALIYDINRKTLYNWCKAADVKLRSRRQICWKDQQKIHDLFGDPEEYAQQQKDKAEKEKKRKDKRL